MNWSELVSKLTPYIVKIETPSGSGTGFLCLYNQDRSICGIATALHVVAYADEWEQPIKIRHSSGQTLTLHANQRAIRQGNLNDSAVVLFQREHIPFPDILIPLQPKGAAPSIGSDVGFLGYPAIEPHQICFFTGVISAHLQWPGGYLIDGVAINGVSGGPVFYSHPTDGVHIVGSVSAYRANRTTGEALPGLLVAQDVSHFHEIIGEIKTVDEARPKSVDE